MYTAQLIVLYVVVIMHEACISHDCITLQNLDLPRPYYCNSDFWVQRPPILLLTNIIFSAITEYYIV